MQICPFCGKEGKSVKYHVWRMHGSGKDHDPSRGYKNNTRTGWNKGKTKETDSRVNANANAIKLAVKDKPVVGCFAWSKEQRSINAKKQGFGGYRENAGRSKKFKVVDSFGKETTLQSTYELKCFEILTQLKINWFRPKALKYDGKNYFADFYLPDYDLYLDPKNNYKAKLDSEKINKVIEQNAVSVFILLENELTTEHITRIVKWL